MEKEEQKNSNQIQIHYLKDSSFRTCVASGVIGGITASGQINANFYIDRNPIPNVITHELNENIIGDVISTNGKEGLLREISFGILINLSTAQQLVSWLSEQINVLQTEESKSE